MISMDNGKPENEELKIPPIELLREELAREEARYSFRKTVWNIIVALIVAAAVTALIATRLLLLIRINGNSMSPALLDGEVVSIRPRM